MKKEYNSKIVIETEAFWLYEAIVCLGWIYPLDCDDWLNEKSSWSREQKEEFLAPYRKFREGMRDALLPTFEQYPVIMKYIDTAPRSKGSDQENYDDPLFAKVVKALRAIIEQKEEPGQEDIVRAMNQAYVRILCDEQSASGEENLEIHGLEDMMQAVMGWDAQDGDKFRLIRLYTESRELVSALRRLNKPSIEAGHCCMEALKERYMLWEKGVREKEELVEETILRIKWERDVLYRIYPGIMGYNALQMNAYPLEAAKEGAVEVTVYLGLEVFYMMEENRRNIYEDRRLLADLKAISDATRLNILHLLAERPRYLQELARQLDLTPATVSHHLAILSSADLVSFSVEEGKKKVYYHLVREHVSDLGKRVGFLALNRKELEAVTQAEMRKHTGGRKKWQIV